MKTKSKKHIKNTIRLKSFQKMCTWIDCFVIAKHQRTGSLIALCDKHNKELESSLDRLLD